MGSRLPLPRLGQEEINFLETNDSYSPIRDSGSEVWDCPLILNFLISHCLTPSFCFFFMRCEAICLFPFLQAGWDHVMPPFPHSQLYQVESSEGMRESIGDWLRQVPGLSFDFLTLTSLWIPLRIVVYLTISSSDRFIQKKLCISEIGLLLGKTKGIGDGAEYSKLLSASLHVPETSKLCLTVGVKIIILPRMVLSVCGGNIWNFVM